MPVCVCACMCLCVCVYVCTSVHGEGEEEVTGTSAATAVDRATATKAEETPEAGTHPKSLSLIACVRACIYVHEGKAEVRRLRRM